MWSLGVEGCPAGWFVVALSGESKWEASVYPSIREIWDRYGDNTRVILIDIPIGLLEAGVDPRLCDRAAREVLGRPRSSSVFPVPTRVAIYAENYREACLVNEELTGKRISKQAWNISPKIREVDTFLNHTPEAIGIVRESHPEVVFWGLANGRPMRAYKKTPVGEKDRSSLLEKYWTTSTQIVSTALESFTSRDLSKDDVLDALALAIAAYWGGSQLRCLPPRPALDARDLPMEIVYWDPGDQEEPL